jgi:hypothetical protein
MFTTAATFLVVCASASFAYADVPLDKNFEVKSTPETWATGSKICFTQNNQPEECAKVTNMGEIKLREDSTTAPEVMSTYVNRLSPDDQKNLGSYKKFFVRYLALDGDTQGRYIVQVFFQISLGTQAIYVYGNYQLNGQSLTVTPVGYGESSELNLSFMRSDSDDQAAIRIAQSVIETWAAGNGRSISLAPKN